MSIEENTIAVFIVAASPIARAGLKAVLEPDVRFVIAGGAAKASAAPFDFSGGQSMVDVILINVERKKDFDDLMEIIGGDVPEAIDFSAVVVLLLPPELQKSEYVSKAVRNGVRGALPHDASAGEIAAVVQAAANNLISFAPDLAEEIFAFAAEENFSANAFLKDREPPFQTETIENLTTRERQILEMLAEGASNKSIASRLNISEHTVKFHVASVFGKLGAGTRTEAVTQALKRGLILL